MIIYVATLVYFLHSKLILTEATIVPTRHDCVEYIVSVEQYYHANSYKLANKSYVVDEVQGSCEEVTKGVL